MKTSAVLCFLVVVLSKQSEVSANPALMFFRIILNVSVVLILAYCSVNQAQFLAFLIVLQYSILPSKARTGHETRLCHGG